MHVCARAVGSPSRPPLLLPSTSTALYLTSPLPSAPTLPSIRPTLLSTRPLVCKDRSSGRVLYWC